MERIRCDCSKVEITECEHGEPLSIGRKSRIIPPAIRRMLWARDGEVRFEDRHGERLEEQPGNESTTLEEALAWMYRKYEDRDIDSESCASKYFAGETMDYDYAVSVIFESRS
ncbi:MAG: hypothetical protein MJA32_14480 [Proteobacteria bacterium]|nr:hypothetical protein [Pseudomonadota bacterium]